MGKFLKEWWSGIVATLILGVEIMTNYPDVQISLGMILFLVFAFIQMATPQTTLNKIKNAKPNLKVKRAYIDKRSVLVKKTVKDGRVIGFSSETGSSVKSSDYQYGEISYNGNTYGQPATETRTEIYSFAHVSFINEPKSSLEHATAKKVWAEIELYNSAKKLRWGNIKGRWSDTTQPVLPNQVKRDLLQVDFEPNQLEWELDIATRNVNEIIGFVFNNDSYEFAEFMRNDMVLQEDLYFVKIILRGVGLNPDGEKFCFRLDNKAVGGLEISEINCF